MVPIPTLPVESILTFSVPLVLNNKLLAPVALIFKFPAFVNVGVVIEVVPDIVEPVTLVAVTLAVPVLML